MSTPILMVLLLLSSVSAAADAGEKVSESELAKQDQNPLTRFYVMRFEDNVQLGFGPDDEPINFFRIQPLIPIEMGKALGRDLRPVLNYNLPHGWYLTSSPSIAANWEAEADERWLVPVGGGVGKVYSIGRQRMSTTIESYYHAVSPSIGPEWQLRVQHSFLYRD